MFAIEVDNMSIGKHLRNLVDNWTEKESFTWSSDEHIKETRQDNSEYLLREYREPIEFDLFFRFPGTTQTSELFQRASG